jgi:hypothetical protein
LLKESMDSHDGTHITCQVSATGCDGQILDRVQAVGVDHEVAVILVDCRSLAPVAVVEELGHSFPLDVMNGVHVEPCAVAWQDNGVGLRDEVLSGG